ncbi:transporter [Aquimarina sp. MMG016]|nr:transporter [Aquimarina sp. MMG016]
MSPKSILLLVSLLLLSFIGSAQYTEKINSNRPGTSQGAFSVGNNVLQFEGGFGFGKQKHKILNTRTNTFNFDYTARYGLLIEQLEIRFNGKYRSDGVRIAVGGTEEKIRQSNFELNTIGAKYLIYDPYKKPKEKDSIDYEDLKSWRRTHRFKWKSLIPAVSAYVGANFVTKNNPFTASGDEGFSPKVVLATQNNWNTRLSGDWALVTNLIFDKITTDDLVIGWIITSTHTIRDKWAVFGEYQGQKSDFYSDDILRLGGAYLFNKDLQIDTNVAFNFKDTPSIFTFSVGASYRFDWHTKDEIIEKPGLEGGVKEKEEEGEGEDGLELDEFEQEENDSLKLGKTPFINEFEDDSFRDAIEQDLDERRTEERLERERIEAEKIAKKEDKKFQKEERRRLKREEKEAKKAEKARLKEEKEKQKMIDDIDAELDKIEQDEGIDNQLDDLDAELKKLEEEEAQFKSEEEKLKEAEQKQAEEDQNIDDEYEKLQQEQAKAEKEEAKRRKKAEAKRKKEERKRKKEEAKRKKQEAKKKKQEANNEKTKEEIDEELKILDDQ